MKRKEIEEFWSDQRNSGQPVSDDDWLLRKAEEHVLFMHPDDRDGPIIDFACGSGELLTQFAKCAGVVAGMDFSASMLFEARRRLGDAQVKLIEGDGFNYSREAVEPVWTTCSGMNQYLSPKELLLWIESFIANPHARSLYLFDCVDPIRRRWLSAKSAYREGDHRHVSTKRRAASRIKSTVRNVTHDGWANLGSAEMGYGYTPSFFRKRAAYGDVYMEFVSSRYFEYRFHVALRKRSLDL